MRLALLLFGISKIKTNRYYINGENFIKNIKYIKLTNKGIIDYNYSYDNYKEYIFDFFEKKGYTIDTYFSTNILDKDDEIEILEKYKPVAYNFMKDELNGLKSRNVKFDNVITMCLEKNINYDLVLITRFDLLFQQKFNKSNIKLNKFNLVSILEHPSAICDNFYLFPYKYLKDFSIIIKKKKNTNAHHIKEDIENLCKPLTINYILNEYVSVSRLSFYKIKRSINKNFDISIHQNLLIIKSRFPSDHRPTGWSIKVAEAIGDVRWGSQLE